MYATANKNENGHIWKTKKQMKNTDMYSYTIHAVHLEALKLHCYFVEMPLIKYM